MAKFWHQVDVEGEGQSNVQVEVTEGDTLVDVSIGAYEPSNLNTREVEALIATLQAARAVIDLNR